MINQVMMTIKENALIENGDKIVVGFSGGPDSLTMLHALIRLSEQLNISLVAVHVNHMLRGELADQDEAFCVAFCEANKIPCYTFKVDVTQLSQEYGTSFEEAGRDIRYEKFEFVKKAQNANKIAIAQNKNDVTETFFINLFRGAGIEGLASVDYVRDRYFIRPLLDVSRDEIENYCKQNELVPRRDHTNDENDYLRNKIRNSFLPYIRESFNPSIDDAIYKTVQIMKSEKTFWSVYSEELFETYCTLNGNSIALNIEKMMIKTYAEKSQLIRFCVKKLKGSLTNFSYEDVQQILKLNRSGAVFILDDQYRVVRSYDQLIFCTIENEFSKNSLLTETLYIKIISIEEKSKYRFHRACVAIDADQVVGEIRTRTKLPGDKFVPLGMNSHKKIKNFLIDEKIPLLEREKIQLVCDDEKIIWVKDMRISELCKITDKTKNIMILSFQNLVENL